MLNKFKEWVSKPKSKLILLIGSIPLFLLLGANLLAGFSLALFGELKFELLKLLKLKE